MNYVMLGVRDAAMGNPPYFDKRIGEYDTDNEEHLYWAGRHLYADCKAKILLLTRRTTIMFKVGDKVRVLENIYDPDEKGWISDVGSIGYVTFADESICMVASYPECNPYEHSRNSLCFSHEEIEHV